MHPPLKWVKVEDSELRHGAVYCVGRGDDRYPDIGTWYPSGWECVGDEWPDTKALSVMFVLNGAPLPK